LGGEKGPFCKGGLEQRGPSSRTEPGAMIGKKKPAEGGGRAGLDEVPVGKKLDLPGERHEKESDAKEGNLTKGGGKGKTTDRRVPP